MSDFEEKVLTGLATLQAEMLQVKEKLKDQTADIDALRSQVDELVTLKTEAAASARVLRWSWAVVSFVGGGLIAWLTKEGAHK